MPKDYRYTLGTKIDALLIETAEALYTASWQGKEKKLPYLGHAIKKLDLVKFFLQVSWESNALDTKQYAKLSEHFDEVGRQLGAWYRKIEKETPAK